MCPLHTHTFPMDQTSAVAEIAQQLATQLEFVSVVECCTSSSLMILAAAHGATVAPAIDASTTHLLVASHAAPVSPAALLEAVFRQHGGAGPAAAPAMTALRQGLESKRISIVCHRC